MSTGDKFGIGSIEAPYENVSSKVLAAFRDGGLTYVILSLYEFVQEFESPSLDQRLVRAHINIAETIKLFMTDAEGDHILATLLMNMEPRVLQSVLLGTIARDAAMNADRWPISDGPGVYAVGVAVDGRRGGFLNSVELEVLADHCDKYAQAYRISRTSSTLPQQPKVILDAHAIDSAVSLFAGPGFRSVDSAEEVDRITLFAERLRVRAVKAKQVDPSGTSIQYQSPLYIGCASNIDERIRAYSNQEDNGRPAFDDINKLLGLTINILSFIGLPSQLVAMSVLPISEFRELDVAERLVVTLASSLVAQDGFNTAAVGPCLDNVWSDKLNAQRDWIYSQEYVESNIAEVTEKLQIRNDNLDKLEELEKSYESLEIQLQTLLQQMETTLAEVAPTAQLLSDPVTRALIVQQQKARIDDLKQRLQIARAAGDLLDILANEAQANQGPNTAP